MLQIARVTAFTVSELSRERQQGNKKSPSGWIPKLGLSKIITNTLKPSLANKGLCGKPSKALELSANSAPQLV